MESANRAALTCNAQNPTPPPPPAPLDDVHGWNPGMKGAGWGERAGARGAPPVACQGGAARGACQQTSRPWPRPGTRPLAVVNAGPRGCYTAAQNTVVRAETVSDSQRTAA